jgi:(2Fe-2S) ferredoxin
MVAEWFGPKKCCGHIMGKNCLQAHVTSNGPWKHKCPLCRDVWYHAVAPEKARRFVEEEEEEEPPVLRRSARIARMEAAREGSVTAQASMSQRHGVSRAARRERQRSPSQARAASAAFSSQLMAALQVEKGGKHVHGSLEEIKERLSALYSGLER